MFQYTDWENTNDEYMYQRMVADIVGDYFFICPSIHFAQLFADRGMNVYYYFFTQVSASPRFSWPNYTHPPNDTKRESIAAVARRQCDSPIKKFSRGPRSVYIYIYSTRELACAWLMCRRTRSGRAPIIWWPGALLFMRFKRVLFEGANCGVSPAALHWEISYRRYEPFNRLAYHIYRGGGSTQV